MKSQFLPARSAMLDVRARAAESRCAETGARDVSRNAARAAAFVAALLLAFTVAAAETNRPAPAMDPLTRPLGLADALNLALAQNSTIRKSQSDLEASYGVVVQTRAIALPRLRASSDYVAMEEEAVDKIPVERIPLPGGTPAFTVAGDQRWSAEIRLIQSIYEGGRIVSALRTARLTKEQALLNHQTVIANTLTDVRVAYADVLLGAQLIVVQEASVELLTKELEDTTRRFNAGTVPRFNVLRAEVELANARPRLIRARNAYRIAKNNLANLLGYDLPKDVWEDIPMQLVGKLEAEPYAVDLPQAVGHALAHRSELGALRKAEALRREAVTSARSHYKPSVQLFAGYGSRSSIFSEDLTDDRSGWMAGGQLSWDIFDGFLTRGRVQEAEALQRRAREEIEDTTRRIELEVRTTYSTFIEAKEVLESQKKVVEQGDEALRLANARSEAGSGTQLDVLNAQTALTEARTTQIQAQRDYVVARARLERAMGQPISPGAPNSPAAPLSSDQAPR